MFSSFCWNPARHNILPVTVEKTSGRKKNLEVFSPMLWKNLNVGWAHCSWQIPWHDIWLIPPSCHVIWSGTGAGLGTFPQIWVTQVLWPKTRARAATEPFLSICCPCVWLWKCPGPYWKVEIEKMQCHTENRKQNYVLQNFSGWQSSSMVV